jgi:hypothetical protein
MWDLGWKTVAIPPEKLAGVLFCIEEWRVEGNRFSS